MILTIDIGNTNITFGVFDGDKLSFVSRLATERNRTDDTEVTLSEKDQQKLLVGELTPAEDAQFQAAVAALGLS